MVCTGTSQLFRRPKGRKKQASTMGAHSSLREKGHEHMAKMALALYDNRAADAAVVDDDDDDDIVDPATAAAAATTPAAPVAVVVAAAAAAALAAAAAMA